MNNFKVRKVELVISGYGRKKVIELENWSFKQLSHKFDYTFFNPESYKERFEINYTLYCNIKCITLFNRKGKVEDKLEVKKNEP